MLRHWQFELAGIIRTHRVEFARVSCRHLPQSCVCIMWHKLCQFHISCNPPPPHQPTPHSILMTIEYTELIHEGNFSWLENKVRVITHHHGITQQHGADSNTLHGHDPGAVATVSPKPSRNTFRFLLSCQVFRVQCTSHALPLWKHAVPGRPLHCQLHSSRASSVEQQRHHFLMAMALDGGGHQNLFVIKRA